MIEFRHVTKTYPTRLGRNVVLGDVTTVFPRGVNVGIVGRNGAGKSTLLRLVAGVIQPDAGSITRHVRVSPPIGFAGGFSSALSAEENCRFIARIHGLDADEVVGFTKAFAEIGPYFNMPMKTYSSGMKGRVAFGVSMAVDYDVYLIDEATSAGDGTFRKKCADAFRERRARSSVIMVSHNVNTLKEYCDQYAVIQGGRLRWCESLEAASASCEN